MWDGQTCPSFVFSASAAPGGLLYVVTCFGSIGRMLEFRGRGSEALRGIQLLRTIPPSGFEQQVVLRGWFGTLGAKWFGARGILSFASGGLRSVNSKLLCPCDLRFASCGGISRRRCKTGWFCVAREGNCSVIAVSTRFDSGQYSMGFTFIDVGFGSCVKQSRQMDVDGLALDASLLTLGYLYRERMYSIADGG